jgi:uncharacterized protein YecT (DUF1311 family)
MKPISIRALLSPAVLPALLLALLASGGAQAQLKMPTPVQDSSAPAPSPAPKPGTPSPAPGAAQPNPNVAQPNMPDPISKEFRACVQKVQDAGQATKQADPVAAQACFAAETKRQEGKIATGAQRVSKILNAGEKKRFDDANTAWRHFRDVECAFFADPKSNPVESANNAQCVLDRTIRRALDMEGLALAMAEREAALKAQGSTGAGAAPAPAAPPAAATPPVKK